MKSSSLAAVSLLTCTAMLFSSCASIVSKSNSPVTSSSTPSGASVTVTNGEGVAIHTATTPTTVTLKSSAGYFRPASYVVTFNLKGHPPRKVELNAGFNGWYIGNLVFGGLVGILIVDPLTGAMWRLDDSLSTDFTHGVASADAGHSLKIMNRADVPKAWEGKLVAMNAN